MKATAHTDGACDNNGSKRAGYGVSLRLETGETVEAYGCVGMAETSNLAEYHALLVAFDMAVESGVTDLEVLADSQLMVYQMTGRYKVKHPNMQRMHAKAKASAARIRRVIYRWIPREENYRADELSKFGMETERARLTISQ